MLMPPIRDSVITISLLDPVRGHAVQSWEFDGAAVIRIGRASTNDVILNDLQVSRVHGELIRTDAGWNITPLAAMASPSAGARSTVQRRLLRKQSCVSPRTG